MAVKMRLIRMGKKKTAYYRVVVMDGRTQRDGRYIEQIGVYDPNHEPSKIEIDNERAIDWMSKGAQPTEPVRKLLEISGALSKYKVASGKIHTVATKAPVPEPAVEELEETVGEAKEVPAAESDGSVDESLAEVAAEAPEEVASEVASDDSEEE